MQIVVYNSCFKFLSLRTSALASVAIPRLERKCIDNCPTERGNIAFLVVIVIWFYSSGGIATPLKRTGLQ